MTKEQIAELVDHQVQSLAMDLGCPDEEKLTARRDAIREIIMTEGESAREPG